MWLEGSPFSLEDSPYHPGTTQSGTEDCLSCTSAPPLLPGRDTMVLRGAVTPTASHSDATPQPCTRQPTTLYAFNIVALSHLLPFVHDTVRLRARSLLLIHSFTLVMSSHFPSTMASSRCFLLSTLLCVFTGLTCASDFHNEPEKVFSFLSVRFFAVCRSLTRS